MVKQSPRLPASNVSANPASLWSSGLHEDPTQEEGEKKATKGNQKTNRDVRMQLQLNHGLVLCAGTLELNLSETFTTLLERRQLPQSLRLPMNRLQRRGGRRSHQGRPVPSAQNNDLSHPGRDLPGKVPQTYFTKQSPPLRFSSHPLRPFLGLGTRKHLVISQICWVERPVSLFH